VLDPEKLLFKEALTVISFTPVLFTDTVKSIVVVLKLTKTVHDKLPIDGTLSVGVGSINLNVAASRNLTVVASKSFNVAILVF